MISGVCSNSCKQYKSIQSNINFKGTVSKEMKKFIGTCAKRECENFRVLNTELDSTSIDKECTKIITKWNTLLNELFEKMSKEHENSVLDYQHSDILSCGIHYGDIDHSAGRILYRNSQIKNVLPIENSTVQRILFEDDAGKGFVLQSNKDLDPTTYAELIYDKDRKCFPYGKFDKDGDIGVEKYPSDLIYDNIKDFVQKTDDTTLAQYYQDNIVNQKKQNASIFEKFQFGRNIRKIMSFWKDIGFSNSAK